MDATPEMLSPCESIVVLLVHTIARTVARVSYNNSPCLAWSRRKLHRFFNCTPTFYRHPVSYSLSALTPPSSLFQPASDNGGPFLFSSFLASTSIVSSQVISKPPVCKVMQSLFPTSLKPCLSAIPYTVSFESLNWLVFSSPSASHWLLLHAKISSRGLYHRISRKLKPLLSVIRC